MPQPSAPADVVRAAAAAVSHLIAGDFTEQEKQEQLDRVASFYAENIDVQHPFRPLGDTPVRTRAELRAHYADAPGQVPGAEGFEAVGQVYETQDPEVVIYEFSYVGSLNGRPFTVPCIFVTRVRDGVIVESREYADHVGMARTFGRLDAMVNALSARAQR